MKRKRAILALLLATLAVGAVYAATVLIYEWTLTLTGAIPDVRFIKWANSTLHNTVDLPYNIYADMWIYDANATYGIRNTNATLSKTVDIYINTISDTTKVANVTVQILTQDGDTVKATCTWATTGSLPTSKQSFTADPSTNYIIRVWVKGSTNVVATDSVTVGMKLEVAE